VNKTAAYTMQRNFATALCARPFYDFCDRHLTAGGVSFEQVYDHMSQHFCKGAKNVKSMQLVMDEAIDRYPPKDTIVVPQVRPVAFVLRLSAKPGARMGLCRDPRCGQPSLPRAPERLDGRHAPTCPIVCQARVPARGDVPEERRTPGESVHCQVPFLRGPGIRQCAPRPPPSPPYIG
jgi:hypothetical protein